MLRAVFLLFPLLLFFSFFPSLLFFIVSFLLLMFLFMRIGTTHVRRRGLLSTEHLPRLVLMFLMLIFMFSLRGLIYISILLWQLQSYIMQFSNLHIYTHFRKKSINNSYIYIKLLTGPGCNRKPASCTLVKGNNSLPPIGGFSITDLNELKKKRNKINRTVI